MNNLMADAAYAKTNLKNTLKNLYPWFIWFLSSSFIFYKYVLQVSPSIMVNELMKAFSLSGESMGSLAAFYFYAYLVMQLPAGLLLDRFNPRYIFSAAILICASGAWMFSHATTLYTAELGRLLVGIGGAFSAVGTMKFISLWFPPKKFALVSGLMMTMAMLGAIGGEAPLAYLSNNLGWRHAIEICAVIGLLLATLFFLMARDKPASTSPAKRIKLAELFQGLAKLLKNKQSWLISAYSGLAFAPVSAFAGLWGIPFIMQKYGLHKEAAAGLVSIAFIGFAIGSPLGGWLSDRIQRRQPIMIVGTSVSLLSLSTIIYYPELSYLSLSILLLIFGLCSGFFFVSFAHIREINNPELSGSSIGFINMFDALFGALSEPLIGKLLDLGWHGAMHQGARIFSVNDYQNALIILPAAMIVALILQIFIKETYCQSARL